MISSSVADTQQQISTLENTKKIIKTPPFDQLNPIEFVNQNSNYKKQSIQPFHHLFLVAMGSPKARQLACKNYQKLFRQNLIDQNSLPVQLISSILGACASTGSTTGSSMGSVSSTVLQGQQSLHVAKLISVILIKTPQTIYELTVGLNYLLEGTRSKVYSGFNISLIQQVYQNCLVVHYRKPPFDRFISNYLSLLINQVSTHLQLNPNCDPSFWTTKKVSGIFSHEDVKGQGKFGLCFICRKQANNYEKNLLLPLCGMQCKYKLLSLYQQSKNVQISNTMSFNIMGWLMDHIHSQNPAIYSLLARQIKFVPFSQLKTQYIETILKQLIKGMNISPTCAQIYRNVISRKQISFNPQSSQQQRMVLNKQSNAQIYINHLIHINLLQTVQSLHSKISFDRAYLVEHIINPILKNPNLFFKIYQNYDCKFFQADLLGQMLNIVRQYAMSGEFSANSQTGLSSSTGSTGFKQSGRGSNDQIGGTSINLGKISTNFQNMSTGTVSIQGGCRILGIQGICGLLSMLISLDKLDEVHEAEKRIRSNQIIEDYQFSIDSSQLGSKRRLQKIIKLFNKKPLKGIKLLKQTVPNITPKEIAILIRQNLEKKSSIKNLLKFTKDSVGQYFCSPDQEAIKVYTHFLELIDFGKYKNIDIDDVWRIILSYFTMPKQAQQVERLLNVLSAVYLPFSGLLNDTAVYQYAFTAMMVQTGRNPNVKESEKLKINDFLSFCKQIQGGVDQERATQLFQRLKNKPLQNAYEYTEDETIYLKYLKWGLTNYDSVKANYKQQQREEVKQQKQRYQREEVKQQRQKQQKQTEEKRMQDEQPNELTNKLNQSSEIESPRKKQTAKQQSQKQVISKIQSPSQLQQSQVSVNNSLSEGFNSPKRGNQNFKAQKGALLTQLNLRPSEQDRYWRRFSFAYMQTLLEYIWEFIYISIVNKSNNKGLMEATVLYGKYQLHNLQNGFFVSLCKHYEKGSEQCYEMLLKLGIYYGNYLSGSIWAYIIKLIYGIQENMRNQKKPFLDYESFENSQSSSSVFTRNFLISAIKTDSDIIDKFFTKSQNLSIAQLKIFVEQLCEFSSSEFKTDRNYNRQLFVLRHITQVIQYNLHRLDRDSFQQIWPSLQRFYLNICLHPKRDLAMAAIDSYKQLLMKIIPLSYQIGEDKKIPLNLMLQVYFQVFERSNAFIRDLVVNILLNIVNPKLQSGWQVILKILQHADCEDQKIVMRIVGRIIDDVGLESLKKLQSKTQDEPRGCPNLLLKLHDILLRQLKLANENTHVSSILPRVWKVAGFINTIDTWTETLISIKDIYKKTLNNDLLPLFYNLVNKSAQMAQKQSASQLRTQIFNQAFDMAIYLIEVKERKLLELALHESTNLSSELVLQFIKSPEENSNSILNLWRQYLDSPNRLIFALHIKRYLPKLVQFQTREQQRHRITHWLIGQFHDTNPGDLIPISDLDKDFKIGLLQIQKDAQIKTTKLIEFPLSEADYHLKSMVHLILLDTIKQIIPIVDRAFTKKQKLLQIKEFISANILQSFSTAFETNDLVVLRYFLFKNDFMNVSSKKSRKTLESLPGLHKQQTRSLQILLNYSQELGIDGSQKLSKICIDFFAKYEKLIGFIHRDQLSTSNSLYQLCKKDANLWIINAQKAILGVLRLFVKSYTKQQQIDPQKQKKLFFCQTKNYLYKCCLKLCSYRICSQMLRAVCELLEILTPFIVSEQRN